MRSGVTTLLLDADRFWGKVEKTSSCWLWTAARTDGYGRLGNEYAHRVAYRMLVGPIPLGLQLDHLCRVRHCVNPAHLEPVTQRENVLRGETIVARNAVKTHCPHGHPLSGHNLRLFNGHRSCKLCNASSARRYRARKIDA